MFLSSFLTFWNWVYALYTFHFFFKIRMQANVTMRLGLLPLAEHFYLSKLFLVHFVYLINAEQQRSWQQETSLLGEVCVSSTCICIFYPVSWVSFLRWRAFKYIWFVQPIGFGSDEKLARRCDAADPSLSTERPSISQIQLRLSSLLSRGNSLPKRRSPSTAHMNLLGSMIKLIRCAVVTVDLLPELSDKCDDLGWFGDGERDSPGFGWVCNSQKFFRNICKRYYCSNQLNKKEFNDPNLWSLFVLSVFHGTLFSIS